MTKVLYLAEPIDQAGTMDRGVVNRLLWHLGHRDWAVYRPYTTWSIGTGAEPGPEVDRINRDALEQSNAVIAYLPSGVPTIGVPREIELARSYEIPVLVLRPGSNGPSWAIQDIPVVHDARSATDWLDGINPAEPRGISFYIQPGGRMPSRIHAGDVGYDLYSSEDVDIPPGEFRDIRTGVLAALPPHVWARITGRSSTWRKRGLMVMEGIIDSGYRGELLSGVFNPGPEVATIEIGDRLAQLIPHLNLNGSLPARAVGRAEFNQIPAPDQRGADGFGSSGN